MKSPSDVHCPQRIISYDWGNPLSVPLQGLTWMCLPDRASRLEIDLPESRFYFPLYKYFDLKVGIE